MVNPLEFLKVGGFSPQVSVAAKEGLVWQTHDMMLIGGTAWAWGQRLVKSLSNEAFNELNGRKKIEINGAPIDQQINQAKVEDGLFRLILPHLEASAKHFREGIERNQENQKYLIKKSMDLKQMELEATFTLLGKLPADMLSMILTGYGLDDYESKLKEKPKNDPTNKGTWEDDYVPPDDQDFKPPPKEKPTQKPQPDNSMITLTVKYDEFRAMEKRATSQGFMFRIKGMGTKIQKYTATKEQHKKQLKAQENHVTTMFKRYGFDFNRQLPSLVHASQAQKVVYLANAKSKLIHYSYEYQKYYGEHYAI